MAVFFISTLVLSILGLTAVLSLKYWELTTGRVVAGSMRPRIDRFFRSVLFWIERVIPTLLRIYVRRAVASALSLIHRVSAELIVHAEHTLEKTLHSLRHTTDVKRGVGEASAFLREVAEHKRKLLNTRSAPVHLRKE